MKDINSFEELDEYLTESCLPYRYELNERLGLKIYTNDINKFISYLDTSHLVLGLKEEIHILLSRYKFPFLMKIFTSLFLECVLDNDKIRNGIIREEYDDIESWAERKNKEFLFYKSN